MKGNPKMSKYLPIKKIKMWYSNLELLRREKGITQKELADLLGISTKTYRDYELQKVLPRTDILIKLSDYFDVTTDYILGRSVCRSLDNEYIHAKTGLDDNAIDVLTLWNKYDTIPENPLNEDGSFAFETQQENVINILNKLFQTRMEFYQLLYEINGLFNAQSYYPYFFTDTYDCVFPQTEQDNIKKNGKVIPFLNLSKTKGIQDDTYGIELDEDFFENVALQGITKQLTVIKEYLKKQKNKK